MLSAFRSNLAMTSEVTKTQDRLNGSRLLKSITNCRPRPIRWGSVDSGSPMTGNIRLTQGSLQASNVKILVR